METKRSTHSLGLDLKIGVTLLAPFSSSKLTIIERIVNRLKFFPFYFLMYNENDLDLFGKMLLIGLIRTPSRWITQFYKQWMQLSKYGFVPKLVIDQTDVKWGIDLVKTYTKLPDI